MQVTVKSEDILEREGIAKGSGQPYHMAWQEVWVSVGDGEVRKIELAIRTATVDGKSKIVGSAIPEGDYDVDLNDCVYVDNKGKLGVSLRNFQKRFEV